MDMALVCENVLSNRGNPKLVVHNYIMTKDKCRDDYYYWRCENRYSMGCNGYACTILYEGKHYLRHMNAHNHISDPSRKEIIKLVENLRRKAIETNDTPDELITNEISNVISKPNLQSLPSYSSLRRIIAKARRKFINSQYA